MHNRLYFTIDTILINVTLHFRTLHKMLKVINFLNCVTFSLKD